MQPRSGPQDYREKFLFVSGQSPQIITETLYYFSSVERPAIRSGEVCVLTTARGLQAIRTTFFGKHSSVFKDFLDQAGISPSALQFLPENVRLIRDSLGRPLEDVRTTAENELAANQIAAWVRELAAAPSTRLHGSIAGGRKAMSYYLAAAFSLYARPQDTLTHVLVNPPEIEGGNFFFPPKSRKKAISVTGPRGSVTIQRRDIRIELAKIPFVRLRGVLEMDKPTRRPSFVELVRQRQQALERLVLPPSLKLDYPRGIRIAGTRVTLTPLQRAIYYLLAEQRRRCKAPCPGCSNCWLDADKLISDNGWQRFRAIAEDCGADPIPRKWKRDLSRFRQERAKINRAITTALGREPWVTRYIIGNQRLAGKIHYGLPVPAVAIEL